ARLTQVRSALEAVSAKLSAARVQHQRQADLFRKSLASQSDVDLAREQVRELEASVEAAQGKSNELSSCDVKLASRSAQAEVDAAAIRVAQAEHVLGEHVLVAPSAGTILGVHLHLGEI